MNLQQQADIALSIRNIEISDIVFLGITIESYNTNDFHNFTLVDIEKITATNVDGRTHSLLSVNKGAKVVVRNSTFSHVSNIGKGAVAYAGSEKQH